MVWLLPNDSSCHRPMEWKATNDGMSFSLYFLIFLLTGPPVDTFQSSKFGVHTRTFMSLYMQAKVKKYIAWIQKVVGISPDNSQATTFHSCFLAQQIILSKLIKI